MTTCYKPETNMVGLGTFLLFPIPLRVTTLMERFEGQRTMDSRQSIQHCRLQSPTRGMMEMFHVLTQDLTHGVTLGQGTMASPTRPVS